MGLHRGAIFISSDFDAPLTFEERHAYAWRLAHQAAKLLKQDFQAEKVMAFGSLLQPDRFNQRSDVDMAAWGLTPKNWLMAVDAVYNLSEDIDLHLVHVPTCSPQLLHVIEKEGVEL